MAIIGIGTDIVQISRIQKVFEKHHRSFVERILHKDEIQVFDDRNSSVPYLAKRFAAKEAVAKALGLGIADGIRFQDIQVSNDQAGKPVVSFHARTLEISKEQGVKNIFLSLSDEKEYATAYVVLEGEI